MSQNSWVDVSPWLSAVRGALTASVGLLLLFVNVKDLSNDVIYVEYRDAQAIQRKLARERRLHREQMEKERAKRRFSKIPGANL